MVVFPESGCEIMARFLLRSISCCGARKLLLSGLIRLFLSPDVDDDDDVS